MCCNYLEMMGHYITFFACWVQIQNHVTGYLQEAEWCHTKHKPSFKNQVNVTSLTIGAPTVCLSMMASMGDNIIKRAVEWVAGVPNVVIAAGKIVRFMNDIASFEVCSIFINIHALTYHIQLLKM